MELEYSWLTEPGLHRDGFLGRPAGVGLLSVLRHAESMRVGPNPYRGITLQEHAEHIEAGERHFYVAAVEANGVSLDLFNAYYYLDTPYGIITGPELLHGIQKHCTLDYGYTISIRPDRISAHHWEYSHPFGPEDDDLYEIAHTEVDSPDEILPNDELMRRLCERWPAQVELPQMHLILAPSLLKHTGIEKQWYADEIVLSLNENTAVRTREGDVPASHELFETHPIIHYCGFLIPPSISPLFNLSSDCGWPNLMCIKRVILKW